MGSEKRSSARALGGRLGAFGLAALIAANVCLPAAFLLTFESARVPIESREVVDERHVALFAVEGAGSSKSYVIRVQTDQGGYEEMRFKSSEVELAFDADAGQAWLERAKVVESGYEEQSSLNGLLRWSEDYETVERQAPIIHLSDEMAARLR